MGTPNLSGSRQNFASLSNSGVDASVKTSLDQQEELMAMAPEIFGVAQYTGRYGWVSVKLSVIDLTLMQELVVEAWRRTAPKRLVTAYNERGHGTTDSAYS